MGDNEAVAALGFFFSLPAMLFAAWLILREYWRRPRASAQGRNDSEMQVKLLETARRLENRLDYLEAILDSEVPAWRTRERDGRYVQ